MSDKLGALLGLHVQLGVDPLPVLGNKFDRVAEVAMHKSIAIRDSSVSHQDHDLVNRLGVLEKVVSEHGRVVGVGKVSRWVALLSVNELRELGRISQEEDGCVVGDDIPIALVRPQLDGESTRVTSQIVRSGLATDD